MHVLKRNGKKEKFDLSKWQMQIAKVCEGIADVSTSMIEIATQAHFYDGMTTRELDQMALRAMIDLIDEDEQKETGNVNYQYVAGKQRVSMLRKDIYGTYQPPALIEIVKSNVNKGLYTPDLLAWYSEDEWTQMQKWIDHDKDELLPYAAVEQLVEKYLVQNRATGEVVETPQVRYMIASATIFHSEKKDRMKYIKEFYQSASDGMFTLATPVLAGLGTPTKQFSSCVLIKSDDTLKSIFASGQVMADYAAKRAGIGLDVGRLRPLGSPIRGGQIKHTGMIPFLKKWFGDLRSCCLRPDTLVDIIKTHETGFNVHRVALSTIEAGDLIKTYDPDLKVDTFRKVLKVWATKVKRDDQYELVFANNVTLNCSANHPIMVMSGDEVIQKLPGDLTVDDEVITESHLGPTGTKLVTATRGLKNPTGYIDIEVEGTHTFYATNQEIGQMVLTHNSQGGIRNSSATINFPFWHLQFEDMIVLKNNQGTEESRVRHMDYCVAVSSLMWKRFKQQESITLFDPNEVPDLYEAFYSDIDKFTMLYEEYETKPGLTRKVIPADSFVRDMLLKERAETGRYYIMNVDNVQKQGPLDTTIHPIYQTNLCVEVLQCTRPFQTLEDEGEFKLTLDTGVEITLPGEHLVLLANNNLKKVRKLTEDDDIADLLIKEED